MSAKPTSSSRAPNLSSHDRSTTARSDAVRLLQAPQTLEAAHRIAAEHFAFSDEAHMGLRMVDEIARALVNNPFWDFWWD